jgi:hypothetical protein
MRPPSDTLLPPRPLTLAHRPRRARRLHAPAAATAPAAADDTALAMSAGEDDDDMCEPFITPDGDMVEVRAWFFLAMGAGHALGAPSRPSRRRRPPPPSRLFISRASPPPVHTHTHTQQVMCGDYGFRSGAGRLYQGGDGEVPESAFALVREKGRARGWVRRAPFH